MPFSNLNNSSSFATFKSAWYAGVLFLATLFFANENFYLLLPISIFILEFKTISSYLQLIKTSKRLKYSLLLISSFVFLAYINKIFNGNPITSLRDYYSAFLLFPILLLCAKLISTTKTYTFLIYLIVFETIIAIAEYIFNVRTFFPITVPPIDFTSDFLYDHRVFGMSINSSVLSFKLLMALLLIETIPTKKIIYYSTQLIFSIGILITFNRALILTALLFWAILACYKFYKSHKISLNELNYSTPLIVTLFLWVLLACHKFFKSRKTSLNTLHFVSPLLVFILLFLVLSKHSFLVELNKKNPEKQPLEIATEQKIYSFSDIQETTSTIHQPRMLEGTGLNTNLYFTKKLIGSTNGINTSGRTLIWANFLQFIEQNLWFGNGSDKLYFKEIDHENKKFKLVHAHNSYLEFLATHGLILSGFFGFILLYLWRRKNSIFIVSILFFSIFQYGIFWGFSLLDLVFTSFLISPINLLTDENQ